MCRSSATRLEIAYRDSSGQHKWGQFVLHGPSGNVGIGTGAPEQKLWVSGGGARINGVTVGADPAGMSYNSEHQTVGVRTRASPFASNRPTGSASTPAAAPPAASLRSKRVVITPDGDVRLVVADCAEFFETDDDSPVDPGSVLVIGDRGDATGL